MSREEREKKKKNIKEWKAEWVLRVKKDQRGKTEEKKINRESGVEECKEDVYYRETNGIG